MTSKEAFLQIESFCAYDDEVKEALSEIAKDLEVLEIIKKHIVEKNVEYGSVYDGYDKISFIVETLQFKDYISKSTGIHYTSFIIDNDFEKVKEWLEK